MANIFLSLIFGTAAAGSWASGDFSGGIASKQYNPYSVVIISQIFGMFFLLFLIFFSAEDIMNLEQILIGLGGGIFLSIGLVSLYGGLAQERMGIVAPISAIISVLFPATVGILLEGIPSLTQIMGGILALSSVWFVTKSNKKETFMIQDLKLPIMAGLGFGIFKIFIASISSNSIYGPLLFTRIASFCVLLLFVGIKGQIDKPKIEHLPFLALAGILDALGGILFIFAVQFGRLDLAAIFASIHPAFTVLLARIIIKEKVSRQQWFGILGIILSLSLIALA